MKILYLYSELMGYNIPILKEFVTRFNAIVDVIHWDHKKLTPYKLPDFKNINYHNRSSFTLKKLRKFVINSNPDIVYISGTMDKGYLLAVIPLRKKGIPVVTGIDDIWYKTARQRFASIVFPTFRKLFFSHAWVAGPYQYEFAKRIGFKNDEIVFNCLSADTNKFNEAFEDSINTKKIKYPHRFIYAGRFESEKGLDILIQAWSKIKNNRQDWELYMIGNGSLRDKIALNSDIIVLDFMQPEILIKEIEKSGCYILPSRFEPWALVLHEFSAAGLPIICSDICGAVPLFVTSKYNGYTFKSTDAKDLEQKMMKIINSSDEALLRMSENSHKAGQKITPEIAAASFMSILE